MVSASHDPLLVFPLNALRLSIDSRPWNIVVNQIASAKTGVEKRCSVQVRYESLPTHRTVWHIGHANAAGLKVFTLRCGEVSFGKLD
ncbi:hypothetical protein [Pukyongiella litopenaei]|uniref:Uncharacterized protein n=1 Tax=Pukyongiella litopenaei TaxID=2605946 RepID=A0A5C2H3V8_9RHOB|nr:hypothetical protein [Pukyongiella litopenaei]QEP30325.1 hypothetical protein C6Y53_19030 [Pukyongiella litopenaei]